MNIDWGLIVSIASPLVIVVVGVVVGAFLTYSLNRPRLTTYIGHTMSHRLPPAGPGLQPCDVHTHSVVIQNTGWRSANNVRLAHSILPSFNVSPDIEHHVSDLPGGGREIRFPSLVPGDQVTVSYLYFPPVIWGQVTSTVKSDEGFAKVSRLIPMMQYPQWVNKLMAVLTFAGTISVLYVLVVLVRWLVSLVTQGT